MFCRKNSHSRSSAEPNVCQSLPIAQFLPSKTIKYDRIPSKASNIGKNCCQFPFQKYLCLQITPYIRRKICNLILGSMLSHSDHSALRTRVTRAKRKEGSEAAQAGKEKQEGLLPRGSTNEKALCWSKNPRTVGPNYKNLPKINFKISWNWWIILAPCNGSTSFECDAQTPGNGSYVNLHKLACSNNLWKHFGWTYLRRFSAIWNNCAPLPPSRRRLLLCL